MIHNSSCRIGGLVYASYPSERALSTAAFFRLNLSRPP